MPVRNPCTYCRRDDTGKRVVNRYGSFCDLRDRKCWIAYKDWKGLR